MSAPRMRRGRSVLLPHRLLGNIYVRELGRAYEQTGFEVLYGPENFTNTNFVPDIVHLNWPEDLYRQVIFGSLRTDVESFADRLQFFKENGSKVIWTVHNDKPHDTLPSDDDLRAYQLVIDCADAIHHHCERSRERLADLYSVDRDTRQFVAAHGHYFAYKNEISSTDARNRLGIHPEAHVFLHFGALRSYKGIDIVLKAFRKARSGSDQLLIAGRASSQMSKRQKLKFHFYKHISPSTIVHMRSIDSDDIQIYLNAANTVVLGHSHGLNSGVAVLGVSFGRAVLGPDLGCISSALVGGANLLYKRGDVDDLAAKMRQAKELDFDEVTLLNKRLAANWQWTHITEQAIASVFD